MPSRPRFDSQRFLLPLWRLLIFMSTVFGIETVLTQNEFRIDFRNQLIINHQETTNRNEIAKIMNKESVSSFMGTDLREARQRILADVPIDGIWLKQFINPLRLQIVLFSKIPIASGERYHSLTKEQGQIDSNGLWINRNNTNNRNSPIRIKGWHSRYQNKIAEILNYRNNLIGMIKEVYIDQDGVLWLVLTNIGLIRLGYLDNNLSFRLEMIKQLSHTLPITLRGHRFEFIDVSRLEHPEMSFVNQDMYKKNR